MHSVEWIIFFPIISLAFSYFSTSSLLSELLHSISKGFLCSLIYLYSLFFKPIKRVSLVDKEKKYRQEWNKSEVVKGKWITKKSTEDNSNEREGESDFIYVFPVWLALEKSRLKHMLQDVFLLLLWPQQHCFVLRHILEFVEL